jgi:hypothetical protein
VNHGQSGHESKAYIAVFVRVASWIGHILTDTLPSQQDHILQMMAAAARTTAYFGINLKKRCSSSLILTVFQIFSHRCHDVVYPSEVEWFKTSPVYTHIYNHFSPRLLPFAIVLFFLYLLYDFLSCGSIFEGELTQDLTELTDFDFFGSMDRKAKE